MASENASLSEHKNDASSNINCSENKSLARESAPVKTCWYIEPTFSLLEADRFIRASQFPPYEAAILKSELDGKEYFVDHTDQYINYCEECFGARIRDNNVSPENSESNTQQIQQLNKKAYSLDTHWYSNVGGTFMKVSAEMAGMREKKKDGAAAESVVPGQALLKSAKKRLRMNEPLIGLSAKTYVDRALSSGWIGVEGPFIKKFEANLARICGVQAACAVQSGTAALYGAMKGLGVSDKLHHVVVPTYTCAACADAVVHAGGIPIPVDCELESYGLSFEAVERVIREDDQVVGVVIAPCYGVPARDHGAIYKLCKERGIWLCEDNCESYGASMRFDDKGVSKWLPVGSLSTMSVVSVRSEKMVGVGEGGAILSKDAALVSKARWWCSRAPVRGCGMWRVYEHEEVGQNYRLPEILGAVGLAACENLPVMIHNKRRIHQWYLKYLSGTAVEFQQEQEGEQPVWWLNSLLVNFERLGKRNDGRVDNMAEKLGMRLMEAYPHIEIRPAFFPLHLIASFKEHANYPCPNAEYLYSSLFCAPSSAMLCEEDVKEICEAVRWGLETV